MPSDVLQALLGVLAGGAEGYVGTKEKIREEEAASEERKAERDLRMTLLNTELNARAKLAGQQMMNERELLNIRLNADKEQWQADIAQKKEQAKQANEIERAKLAHEITALEEQIAQADRELKAQVGLKKEELDIEKGFKLGIGRYAGAPGSASKAGGINKNLENFQDFLSKTVNTMISAGAASGKVPTSDEINAMLNNLSGSDLVRYSFGLPPRATAPETPPPGGGLNIDNMPFPELPPGMNALGGPPPLNPMLEGINATYGRNFIGPPVPGPQYMLPSMYPYRGVGKNRITTLK